jgi:hypothetical protein
VLPSPAVPGPGTAVAGDRRGGDRQGVRFNRACAALALVWLLGASLVIARQAGSLCDFPQFYMGAAAARAGIWDSLYPIPRPGSLNNPGLAPDSFTRPAYADLAARLGVGNATRFIQPPPAALLMSPLGLVPYRSARIVWALLSAAALWGAALYAARFLARISRRRSRWEGVLVLAIALSPRAYFTLFWGNISPFVALLLGFITWEILRRRAVGASVVLVAGTVLKYVPAVLLPLMVAARRWRILVYSALLAVVLGAVSLAWMGTGPFLTYMREMMPTLGRPGLGSVLSSQSAYAFVARLTGKGPDEAIPLSVISLVGLARWVVLAGILAVLLLRGRPVDWRRPATACAAAAALTAWFMIFSPIFWSHYLVYLVSFWGWILWESQGSRVTAWIALAAAALVWAPWGNMLRILTKATALVLGLAVRRMIRSGDSAEGEAGSLPAGAGDGVGTTTGAGAA